MIVMIVRIVMIVMKSEKRSYVSGNLDCIGRAWAEQRMRRKGTDSITVDVMWIHGLSSIQRFQGLLARPASGLSITQEPFNHQIPQSFVYANSDHPQHARYLKEKYDSCALGRTWSDPECADILILEIFPRKGHSTHQTGLISGLANQTL